MEFPAGRHTRHTPDIAVVESDGFVGKALEVRRVHPVTAIGREHSTIEGVEHDNDGFHNASPLHHERQSVRTSIKLIQPETSEVVQIVKL
jgi:hypothetical protein